MVNSEDEIIDISSHEANLSAGRVAQGITKFVETNQNLMVGDHYKNDELVYDSTKRAELADNIVKRVADITNIKTKLKLLGLSEDEIKIILKED